MYALKSLFTPNFEEHKFTARKLNSVVEWLNAWKCRDIHERAVLLRQPDTCIWLPDTKAYQTWRNTENSFLWLNGKGTGVKVSLVLLALT